MVNPVDLQLERYPAGGPDNLRAWDAADEYLLKQLGEERLPLPGSNVLVVNDSFGALAVALAAAHPASWNDSHLSRLALAQNLTRNSLPEDSVTFIPADMPPRRGIDLVIMKFPRSLAWLQDSLLRLRPVLSPQARVMAGGMIKHTPKRAFDLLESCIGPVSTSLGWKKARLAFASFNPNLECAPALPHREVPVPELGLILRNQANVFSRDKLDLGTRFLLNHLPSPSGQTSIADLGCGSGVLALAMARLCPEAQITGTDESYQAIASACANAEEAGLSIKFEVMEGFRELPDSSQDLVLCNPPFHRDQVVGIEGAKAMFTEARRVLKSRGELRIVGNRHLGYHARLTEMFGGCSLVAEDRKFTVLSAVKS